MVVKVISAIVGLLFGSMSFFITWQYAGPFLDARIPGLRLGVASIVAVLFFVVGALLAAPFARMVKKGIQRWVDRLSKMPFSSIVSGVIGLITGLFIAILINTVLSRIYIVGPYLSIVSIFVLGYLGLYVGYKKKDDIANVLLARVRYNRGDKEKDKDNKDKEKEKSSKNESLTTWGTNPKILDTSVIIDGRITDICRTGFVEGTLVIPGFVLEELRHIADSSDGLKRVRGRRGLDMLNTLRQEMGSRLIISEEDFPKIEEVDSKLVKLAQQCHGTVLTNDFNLNKVAQVQAVPVLNINELSNAVKPVVLPGEEMQILVVKDGKEPGQGVAYLDDGTMVVVEDGKGLIGNQITAVVTSILQTAAGRMIFVRPK